MRLLILASALGLALAVAAALAIWLALGHRKVMGRATLAIVGASVAALLFCAVSGEFEAEWLALAWIVVVTVTAMFGVVRWLGFRLIDRTAGSGIQPEKLQFSLTQLIGLTTVVAAIGAVARLLTPRIATLDGLLAGLAIAICLGALALVTAWATLRPDVTLLKLVILPVAVAALAGLVYYGMEATNADPGLVWGAAMIAYAIALAGALWLVRLRGFRLRSNEDCI
jgi:hypothetical protein